MAHNTNNNEVLKTTTNNKEYKIAQGRYDFWWETILIDRKPFRNWKLYRTTQYKPKE